MKNVFAQSKRHYIFGLYKMFI